MRLIMTILNSFQIQKKDVLHSIGLNNLSGLVIKILMQDGKIIKILENKNFNNNTINVSDLIDGFYLMEVTTLQKKRY